MYISDKTKRQYVTYFDENYILKGISLIQSLQRVEVNFHIHVVCLDDETFKMLLRLNFPEVTPFRLKLLEKNNEDLKKAREDRTLVEFYWTLTPFIIKQILVKMPQDTVLTYVDSDLFFWSSPQAIFDDMGTASVYIHEHNFSDSLQHLSIHGAYNVGLLCFRHNEEALKVLSWWQEKCFEWCRNFIDRDAEGRLRYGDQKYLEYFCSLTEELCVCSLPGAGVAPWNDIKFSLSKNEDGLPLVDGQPVIFYHHHSFQHITMNCISPVGNTYQPSSACIEYFHIPYMCALEQSLTLLKEVCPSFSIDTPPDSALQRFHIIIHKELMPSFTQAGAKASDSFTVKGRKFLYINLGIDTEKLKMQAAESLSDAINNYERFPKKPRLLNLGCGAHFHRSWLNVDIESSSKDVHTFDLRNEWSLPQNFFNMVYHSHVLEHMSEEEGKLFVKRCYNVLKPLGIIRIAVPDLENIVRHYLVALEEAKAGMPGAEHRHRWMLIELIDQVARHHSGGTMAEYCKQSPTPEKDFVLQRIGREGQHLIASLEGAAPYTQEETNADSVGKFRLGGEVHRWMYDAFSLQELLRSTGFEDIRLMQAHTSSLENFVSFNLDTCVDGSVRKPDSLFIEARKPNILTDTADTAPPSCQSFAKKESALATLSSAININFIQGRKGNWGDVYYPSFEEATQAATGYDNQSIFKRVYEAAKSVQQGKALWERDSVLMYNEEYNQPLLASLLDFAKQQHDSLHVLDFGGGLGSTYQQHKSQLQHIPNLSWRIVEQMHVQKCGQREFATPTLSFHPNIQEALKHPVNIILFSGVLQYLNPKWVLEILREIRQSTVTRILIDRTPFRETDSLFTVQKPHDVYPGASYPIHLMDFKAFHTFLHDLGYTLTAHAKALDGTWDDCDFLLLQYDVLTHA